MPRVLILSSYVAASRVGGGAQALCLARLGIEPILVPTVIFGRHPGYGAPGGAAVEPEVFGKVLAGVESQGEFARLDAVITGHFSGAAQVAMAAETIAKVRAASPAARIVVDPIMGDADKGLYVRGPVAEALAAELVPEAGVLAPNAWELARLSGLSVSDPASAVAAARAMGRPVLVSSVVERGAIGAVYADEGGAWFAGHAKSASAPKGTGDLLTAVFTAALVLGREAAEALELAVGAVAEAVAEALDYDELPLTALPTELTVSARVTLTRL